MVSPAFAEEFAKGLRNCNVVHLGSGAHYLQEDHPQAMGCRREMGLHPNQVRRLKTCLRRDPTSPPGTRKGSNDVGFIGRKRYLKK
jgi:hypothetical protein